MIVGIDMIMAKIKVRVRVRVRVVLFCQCLCLPILRFLPSGLGFKARVAGWGFKVQDFLLKHDQRCLIFGAMKEFKILKLRFKILNSHPLSL